MSAEATQEEVDQRFRGHDPATDERLTVRVPADLDAALEELVESGVYPNKSEAVRDGLRMVVERGDDDGE